MTLKTPENSGQNDWDSFQTSALPILSLVKKEVLITIIEESLMCTHVGR